MKGLLVNVFINFIFHGGMNLCFEECNKQKSKQEEVINSCSATLQFLGQLIRLFFGVQEFSFDAQVIDSAVVKEL